MGKKASKVDRIESNDIVIDLLVRHADVPTGEELLARYSVMYSGNPAGQARVRETLAEPVVEAAGGYEGDASDGDAMSATQMLEVPQDEYSALEMTIEAAGEDVNNDYDNPGATVAMEAISEIPSDSATMSFDAAGVDAPTGDKDDDGEDFGPEDNSTVMMGVVDESQVEGSVDGDAGQRNRRKKRRHR